MTYWSHGWWMMLWWIVAGVAIGLVVWGVLRVARSSDMPPSAEEELRRRYARGEIDEREYRRRLAVLRNEPPPVS